MLLVRMLNVRPERVDQLRAWFRELTSRRQEVLATFAQEGTRAETAHLLHGSEGPVLVYVADVQDLDAARNAYAASRLPIDAQHKSVLKECCQGPAETELVFECSSH